MSEHRSPEDPYGYATGRASGYGRGVDLGDDVFIATQEYRTVRMPEELGGAWVPVLRTSMVRLPDGRIGRYLTLAHAKVDVIEMGDEYLWVRKNTQGGEEE